MTSTVAVVRHRVADFGAWKKVYDGFAPTQAEHGVHAHQVLRSIENPDDVIVTHAFDSLEAARAFFAMPELKDVMSQAGVDADSLGGRVVRSVAIRGSREDANARAMPGISGRGIS
jgi:quinol monooxygenase YgiN